MDNSLLLKYFSLKTTAREKEEILRWLDNDPDGSHAELFADMHAVFDGMTLYGGKAEVAPQKSPRPRNYFFAFAAASLALVLTLGLGLFFHQRTINQLCSQTEVISVPSGHVVSLTLQDGTEVWLNSGSELERPVSFRKNDRTIVLRSGEIMLDVAKDASRPFHVLTPNADVKVLGTRFDVAVENGSTTTSLVRGCVQVDVQGRNPIVLNPKEMLSVGSEGEIELTRIADIASVGSWTEGVLYLTDVPFETLMQRFEKAFDIKIVMARDSWPQTSLTRGKVRIIDGVEHALQVLQHGSDFTYSVDYSNNTITIK